VPAKQPAAKATPAPAPAANPIEPPLFDKPLIAQLQQSDVMRTLGGILTSGNEADVTRFGWPTLRTSASLAPFSNTMRQIYATLANPTTTKGAPVLAIVGAADDHARSVAALNVALWRRRATASGCCWSTPTRRPMR
jgi:hypothetical protein